MNELDHVTQTLALTLGVAWASGINLYAAVATLGLLGATGNMDLPQGLEVLANPAVIGAAVLMYCVEFFADKIPGVDSAWDALHTFIRIPAGAVLAAGAVSNVDPALQLAAGLLGATVAGSAHFVKAGTRLLINASPEPFSNSIASVTEDAVVFGGLWLMLEHPLAFLAFLVAAGVAFVLLLPRILGGIRLVFAKIRGWFGSRGETSRPASMAVAAGPGEDDRPTL